jgi:hypothetical protein
MSEENKASHSLFALVNILTNSVMDVLASNLPGWTSCIYVSVYCSSNE